MKDSLMEDMMSSIKLKAEIAIGMWNTVWDKSRFDVE
jgi:hypothetical protein